jgi:hypothetical protein
MILAVTDRTNRVAMKMAENGELHESVIVFTDAIRRNPHLRARMLVRLRNVPSENVQLAEPVDGFFVGNAFVDAVLAKARHWTFEPTGGHTVDVIYPFVFLLPK